MRATSDAGPRTPAPAEAVLRAVRSRWLDGLSLPPLTLRQWDALRVAVSVYAVTREPVTPNLIARRLEISRTSARRIITALYRKGRVRSGAGSVVPAMTDSEIAMAARVDRQLAVDLAFEQARRALSLPENEP